MALKLKTGSVVTVSTATTAVQVSTTDIRVSSIIIQASTTNTGDLYLGDETVTSANGIVVGPGESYEITGSERPSGTNEFFLSDIWLDAETSGNTARVAYFIKRS